MNLPAETFRSMSPLDLHVLSTPPAFVLSQDQTLMFNPYPQLPCLLTTNSPKPVAFSISSRRFTLSNLTVCRRLVALLQRSSSALLVQNDFLCIVFKDRAAAFNVSSSLATTYEIISHPHPLVNPVFRLFPFLYAFGAFWCFLGRVGAI